MEKLTRREWGNWLEDYWWEIIREGRRVRYKDPVDGRMWPLGKAIDLQRNRGFVFLLPPVKDIWYEDRQGSYRTYTILCTCEKKGCPSCFGSGYIFRHDEVLK